MENTSLYHAGVKGMRWGVRRYQNKDGSLTPAGRKRYATAASAKTKSDRKARTEEKTKLKAAKAEQEKALTTEEKKSKVLASRSAKELYENRKMFNYDEMTNAHKLLEVDKKVKDMIVEEPNKVEKFFDRTVIPWSQRINKLTANIAGITGNIDKISQLFGGDTESTDTTTSKSKSKDKDKDKQTKDKAEDKKSKDKQGKNTSDNPIAGELLGKARPGVKSETQKAPKSTFWDVDYEDNSYTSDRPAIDIGKLFSGSPQPSTNTTAFISNNSSSSVSSLPAPSTRSQNFVAGLLPAPKED